MTAQPIIDYFYVPAGLSGEWGIFVVHLRFVLLRAF